MIQIEPKNQPTKLKDGSIEGKRSFFVILSNDFMVVLHINLSLNYGICVVILSKLSLEGFLSKIN